MIEDYRCELQPNGFYRILAVVNGVSVVGWTQTYAATPTAYLVENLFAHAQGIPR